VLVFLFAACGLAMPQTPAVRIVNLSRPAVGNFQIGDRFEIVVSGAPHQAVSVRTTRNYAKTDWGPVIASTDAQGQWSTEGRFEKVDFGSWSEVWTVGGRAANPVVSFHVDAPCVPGGMVFVEAHAAAEVLSCDTAAGKQQLFVTPSSGDFFRTPDGRVIPGNQSVSRSAEAYRMKIMESLVTGGAGAQSGRLEAEAGTLIPKLIGVNALTESETRNVLAILRSAGATEAEKSARLALLERLAAGAEEGSLRDEIRDTIAVVRGQ
jgi:hypothetical protein